MALPRVVTWRRLDRHGLVLARLDQGDDGLEATGYEIVLGRSPFASQFVVDLLPDGRTRSVSMGVTSRSIDLGTYIEMDADGEWHAHGRRRRSLDGCLDIDIAANPLTNTFPIRRLGLAVGEERTIRVAWVELPSMRITPVEQTYRRLGPDEATPGIEVWEYRDETHGPYRLTVDEDGLVIEYEGLAERIGPRRA